MWSVSAHNRLNSTHLKRKFRPQCYIFKHTEHSDLFAYDTATCQIYLIRTTAFCFRNTQFMLEWRKKCLLFQLLKRHCILHSCVVSIYTLIACFIVRHRHHRCTKYTKHIAHNWIYIVICVCSVSCLLFM